MKQLKETMKFGIYIHKKNGTIALAEKSTTPGMDYDIDKNKRMRNTLTMMVNVVEYGQGEYFFNKSLRNYEFFGEL